MIFNVTCRLFCYWREFEFYSTFNSFKGGLYKLCKVKKVLIALDKLIFSNKTAKDIILKDEFEKILDKNFINTLTDEKTEKYDNKEIDENYFKEKIKDFSQYFYICGPDAMIESIKEQLLNLGADKEKIVIEQF